MQYEFSEVINGLKPSFIREILKLTVKPEIISFAGGLPDPTLFPHQTIKDASNAMFDRQDNGIFQYTTTEGHLGLRQWIAKRFSDAHHVQVDADQVMIVSGSQQALDLFGKIYINPQDGVVMEAPTYLGAIQAFRMYQPEFKEVELLEDGIDTDQFRTTMMQSDSKFFYGIPNFQNPTGLTYSADKRQQVADILKDSGKLMLEDDPYGALLFDDPNTQGMTTRPIYALAPEHVVYMGSFSKVFVPGFRLGWVIAPKPVLAKMVIAKQAADLHTNSFVQELLYQYVTTNDLDAHIDVIRQTYSAKKSCMVEAIHTYLGDEVEMAPANGGMFIWVRVPGVAVMDLLKYAIDNNVAYVPGEAFSLSGEYKDYMRLNFTSLDDEQIIEGIKRLKAALDAYRAAQ
ncbi:aspartate aminotransferase [Psychrobacter sp. YP14]|uniref:aminotransferase-like domain-containing protein n=1 Tax=Psychrobacter sp. YP14 TaxID=2203895 RepID=UPI000D7D58A7|nr:PLP-dependent aminotransferase family protein [Psychrobacter sp. YP14]AWT48876.1 aspartate aminotransferase [Psychrobacter sp. YP14]